MRRLPQKNGEVLAPRGKVEQNLSTDSDGATIIRQERKYELITPLFGGGVEPKKNNIAQLVNGKTVRGQLRFWWRACRGSGSIEQLKLNEAQLWGAASTPDAPLNSNVSIAVYVTSDGNPDSPFRMNEHNKPRPNERESVVPPYAAFSLQPTEEEIREFRRRQESVKIETVQTGVEFTLRISFPAIKRTDVDAALWCWETFGGIGGRARRGFGSIALKTLIEDGDDMTPAKWKTRDVQKEISEKLKALLAEGKWDPRVPHLPRVTTGLLKVTNAKYRGARTTITNSRDDALKSWWHLIDTLHRFRQSPRNETVFRGESDWPEPDAVRIKVGQHASYRTPTHPIDKFPRAAFGLPIVFKFNPRDEESGDPQKTTLEGLHHNRLSSPLILRPLLCEDGAVCLALILDAPRVTPGGAELKGYGSVVTNLVPGDEIHVPPLKGTSAKIDVLKAFLEKL